MNIQRKTSELAGMLQELRNLPGETEWVEFKRSNAKPDEIGEQVSALANAAALVGKAHGYLVWGVADGTQEIVGTTFNPATAKVGNEELENWLLRHLAPKINYRFHPFQADGKAVVLLEISAAFRHPVQFKGEEFIRVGSYTKKLRDFPERERELWRVFDRTPFEREVAAARVSAEEALDLLDYPAYFDRRNIPFPTGRDGILEALAADEIIVPGEGGQWDITNLGAVLFAKRLTDFRSLWRKTLRVVQYTGDDRTGAESEEHEVAGGYAAGFDKAIDFIRPRLGNKEVINGARREPMPRFPELAVRELLANALIHQDFRITGTGPMVELFDQRLEITNPGPPLVQPERFLDSPPKSRNERLASFMRRLDICEERGTGVDKVVALLERHQLPAPLFETTAEHTRATLFARRDFKALGKEELIRACYLHACLRHAQREPMTSATLSQRFGLKESSMAMASRVIQDALDAGLIRCHNGEAGQRARKYVPAWA